MFVAAGVMLMPLPSATARPAAKVTLAGTTTFTAPTSASEIVSGPRDVVYTIAADANPALLTVSGNGRAIAAVLQPVPSRDVTEAMTVALFNGCGSPGCAAESNEATWLYQREPSGA